MNAHEHSHGRENCLACTLERCRTQAAEIEQLRADLDTMRAALERVRRGYQNILEVRKLYGGRYGALTREEIDGVIAEIDAALFPAPDSAAPGRDDAPQQNSDLPEDRCGGDGTYLPDDPPQASIAPSDDDLAQRPTDSQDQSDSPGPDTLPVDHFQRGRG